MALVGVACARSDTSQPDPSEATVLNQDEGDEFASVAPERFEPLLKTVGVTVVNVHVPVEGELPGTDLFVAYDQIDEATELPKDRAAPIAVYCLTGSMSRQAGQALTELWGQSIRSRTGL